MALPSYRAPAALRLGALVVFAGALAVVPTDTLSGFPSVCLFRNFLGLECPGCGMIRAASCLLHGHPAEAAAFNRLIAVVAPLAGLVAFRDLRTILANRKR